MILSSSLPSLADQRRIVATVEQRKALVDALETQLAASRATAAAYETANAKPKEPVPGASSPGNILGEPSKGGTPPSTGPRSPTPSTPAATKPKSFNGSVEIAPNTAKTRLVQIAEEIIAVLNSDPNAALKVTLEIAADFPEGAPDHIRRAVSENANALGLKRKDWE